MAVKCAASAGRMVVVRFTDGKMLKGTTQDFAPAKSRFHVYQDGDESQSAVPVEVGDVKAIFYVRAYEGDRLHQATNSFAEAKGHGRKAIVEFVDGEKIAGFTMGYHAGRTGFFLVPTDPKSNNERIFVINKAVEEVHWS